MTAGKAHQPAELVLQPAEVETAEQQPLLVADAGRLQGCLVTAGADASWNGLEYRVEYYP